MLSFELSGGLELAVESLQRECEQRQGVLGTPRLYVGQQLLHQIVVDLDGTLGAIEPPRRTLDDFNKGALGHWGEAERVLPQSREVLGELELLVVVRAHGEQRDDGRRLAAQKVAQQDQQEMRLIACLGEKKLLALV